MLIVLIGNLTYCSSWQLGVCSIFGKKREAQDPSTVMNFDSFLYICTELRNMFKFGINFTVHKAWLRLILLSN